MAQRWYVLKTKKPSDALACSVAMRMMGLDAFAPIERHAEKGSLYGPKRWHLVDRQVLPGYVFAKLDLPSEGWAVAVRYVDHILPKGQEPVAPPQEAVERAREAHEANTALTLRGLLHQANRHQKRSRRDSGAILRVTDGPFAGWSVRIADDKGGDKVDGTLLDGSGKDFAPVTIPVKWLEEERPAVAA